MNGTARFSKMEDTAREIVFICSDYDGQVTTYYVCIHNVGIIFADKQTKILVVTLTPQSKFYIIPTYKLPSHLVDKYNIFAQLEIVKETYQHFKFILINAPLNNHFANNLNKPLCQHLQCNALLIYFYLIV